MSRNEDYYEDDYEDADENNYKEFQERYEDLREEWDDNWNDEQKHNHLENMKIAIDEYVYRSNLPSKPLAHPLLNN